MPISFVRKAFDRCSHFMHGYRSGLVGPVLEYAVEKYKSHRRLSPHIRLDEIASEFEEKKAKMMTLSAASNIIIKFSCMYINLKKNSEKSWFVICTSVSVQ